jgi:hypothetical protein
MKTAPDMMDENGDLTDRSCRFSSWKRNLQPIVRPVTELTVGTNWTKSTDDQWILAE